MSPPCHSFHASELPVKVQEDVRGRRRKLDVGDRRVDLSSCELFGMLQYKCEVERPLTRNSAVQCFAVERLFRRCQDKKGSFTVETTEWEGNDFSRDDKSLANEQDSGNGAPPKASKPYQWSNHWHDSDSPSSSS